MGYTHYWRPQRPFTAAEWDELTDGAKRLMATAAKDGIKLCHEYDRPADPPTIDNKVIWFNGAGDEGHETFVMARKPKSKFEFCKTAYKPYDAVVTAILAYLDSVCSDALTVSSDGEPEEWAVGVALAKRAWLARSDQINVPRKVRGDLNDD